jgi:hypothetical protein
MKPKHPPGPPMTLGNMRDLGVLGLDVQTEKCLLSGHRQSV